MSEPEGPQGERGATELSRPRDESGPIEERE